MLIDVTTDVAESIIMPEVMVPAGQTSVTIPVQGGKPGTGALFFKSSAGDSLNINTVVAKTAMLVPATVVFTARPADINLTLVTEYCPLPLYRYPYY